MIDSLLSISTNQSSELVANPGVSSKDALREAVDDFVSIFMAQLFKQMDESIPRSGFIEESFGQKWFREMLYDEYAKSASKQALKPLGDALYKQLSAYHVR